MPKRPLAIAAIVVLGVVLVGGAAFGIYYQSLKSSPQYSLALLVDAAKRDDRSEIAALVDIDAVVEDFVPQITNKAVELYGRGQSPELLKRIARIAMPLLPAVKERARAELPRVIRERTSRFESVPFFAMVLGADRYLDISIDGDMATVRSKLADRPLELRMKRSSNRWQIVGIKEEQVATAIARRIGEQVMAVATGGGKQAADQYGMGNLADLLRQAEELIK
jgi:hypothetical protein